LSTEDAADLLRDLKHWCASQKLDAIGTMGAIPLLMRGGAKLWFEKLAHGDKDTLPHFKAVFEEKFRRNATMKWKDVAEVWSTVQQPTQAVEDYIS
jgi:hypothetical protein